jgi:hypothetical protein
MIDKINKSLKLENENEVQILIGNNILKNHVFNIDLMRCELTFS